MSYRFADSLRAGSGWILLAIIWGGEGGITDKLQEEFASGGDQTFTDMSKVARAKQVYVLFDMSQVCMTLCVTSIQAWYHVMCNIHFLNIIYYPSVITDTGLLRITYRRLLCSLQQCCFTVGLRYCKLLASPLCVIMGIILKNCVCGTSLLLRHRKKIS